MDEYINILLLLLILVILSLFLNLFNKNVDNFYVKYNSDIPAEENPDNGYLGFFIPGVPLNVKGDLFKSNSCCDSIDINKILFDQGTPSPSVITFSDNKDIEKIKYNQKYNSSIKKCSKSCDLQEFPIKPIEEDISQSLCNQNYYQPMEKDSLNPQSYNTQSNDTQSYDTRSYENIVNSPIILRQNL